MRKLSAHPQRKNNWIAATFLAPYLCVFFLFRLGPSLAGFGISLTDWNIVGTPTFVGFKNFAKLFGAKYFYTALSNTFLFVLICVPLLVAFSLSLATLFNQKLKGIGVARAITIIPYVLIPAVVGCIWNWMYSYQFGVLNYYLQKIGLPAVGWLIDANAALPSVAVVIIWSYTGYDMILYLAGLQGIPNSLYEAAKIDGANKRQCFTKITLPLLKPVTSLVVTLTTINTVQVFDQIYVMTNGGPGTSTLTLVQYLYTSAFKDYKMGYASAIGTVIVLILIVVMALSKLLLRERDAA